MDLETDRLSYSDITELVWLKPHGEADDSVCLGKLEDWGCPMAYLEEWAELEGMVLDADRYGAACEATANEAYDLGRF
jgi:hypothetical protein